MAKIVTAIIFMLFVSNPTSAQLRKGEFIDVSIGYGITAPLEDIDTSITGTGFYAQGEYVFNLTKWFGLRPYAGLVLTKSNAEDINQNPTIYKSTSNAFLVGGKTRITAPIPWVAPYLEVGIGASLGSFETVTPFTDFNKKGILMHIPVTIGLALGPKNNFAFEFTYYYHPAAEQFAGAAALGISFPMN